MTIRRAAPRRKSLIALLAVLALFAHAVVGCGDRDPIRFYLDDDDDIITGGPTPTGTDPCQGMNAGSGGAGQGEVAPPAREADRAIAEADIVQFVDGRLYALSRVSGLSVIDVSAQDQLVLLDQLGIDGFPLEMYVDGGMVYALIDHGVDDHRSTVLSIDVANPTSIYPRESVDVLGHLSDSRMVGDVLYVITYEVHVCAGCPSLPTTTITSFDLAPPNRLEQIDQLNYSQQYSDDIGWKRSVTVTSERMYVAGVEWDGISSNGHSTIQVVDISDPDGDLVEGDSVEAAGQILNRWQMDEHEGVLRVLSQPGVWSTADVPTVQTFTVVSSQQLEPLGSLDLELAVPESLRTVRFDGDRAYAITAQATEAYDPTPGAEVEAPPPLDGCGYMCDPLFVVDLSNPAQPVQLGELEMPGWVFHIEPRGDRLIALGFEATYPLGLLNVSLFDVGDMQSPQLLERVTFGGEWSGLSEDQNRIHKAFTIDDQLGLIMVPYGWWEWQEDLVCDDGPCGGGCWDMGYWYQSGAVQLIDFSADTLVARGQAGLDSWALRARIHESRLFAVSNEEVRTFDITNRDAPAETAFMSLY